MSEAVLCALIIALVIVLWPLIRPARRQDPGAVARAVARHPSGRKRVPGLPRDGALTPAERAAFEEIAAESRREWDVLAAEAESFSADREEQP